MADGAPGGEPSAAVAPHEVAPTSGFAVVVQEMEPARSMWSDPRVKDGMWRVGALLMMLLGPPSIRSLAFPGTRWPTALMISLGHLALFAFVVFVTVRRLGLEGDAGGRPFAWWSVIFVLLIVLGFHLVSFDGAAATGWVVLIALLAPLVICTCVLLAPMGAEWQRRPTA